MHRVRILAVLRQRQAPLLKNLFGDGPGEPGIPRIDGHIVADRLPETRAHRAEAGIGLRQRLFDRLRAFIVAAVDKEDGPSAVSARFAGNGRNVARVLYRHGRVKVQLRQIVRVPRAVIAVLFGNFRVDGIVKGVAVVERLDLQNLVVRDEFQFQLPHRLRKAVDVKQLVIGDRLGLARKAHGVETCQIVGDKVVFREISRVAAGNCAGELRCARNFDHAVVAGDGAGRAGDGFCRTRADDAANVLCARQRALGEAFPNGRAGLACDAADTVAGITRDAAKAAAIGNEAQIHAPTDAAGVAALGLDIALVRAVLDDGLELVLALILRGEVSRHVVLGVVAVFDRHRARNAANVQIAVNIGRVFTAVDLAERHEVDIDGRRVGDDVGGIVLRVVDRRLKGIGDLAEFPVDLPDIVRKRSRRAGKCAVQPRDLSGNAADGGVEIPKVGSRHDLRPAGEKPADIHIAARADAEVGIVDRATRADAGAVVDGNRARFDGNIKSRAVSDAAVHRNAGRCDRDAAGAAGPALPQNRAAGVDVDFQVLGRVRRVLDIA